MSTVSGSAEAPSLGVERFAAEPERSLGQLFDASDDLEALGRARELVAAHGQSFEAWRVARDAQGALSRRVGEAKRSGDEVESLLADMREASARRAAARSELAGLLERVLELHRVADADAPVPEPRRPRYVGPTTLRADEPGSASTLGESPDAARWDEYVGRHPARTACHVHGFCTAAERAYGLRAHRLAAYDASGAVVGVLPLVELDHRLLGRALVSVPWVNYGGPLADTPDAEAVLMRGAAALAERLGCPELELRETRPRGDWPELSHKVSMTLALPDTDAALDASLGTRLRAQCAKAPKAGATFRLGGAELVDDFHAVMSVRMRDLGTPFHPLRFFDELMQGWGELARIAIVALDGRPVAAGLTLTHATTLEISWASALPRAKRHDVNMYLYREILRDAVGRGVEVFDFGRSSPGSATEAFKRQWGAVPSPLYWHYRRADGGAPDLDAKNAKFDAAVAVWKRLPVFVTRALGPSIAPGLR